MTTGKRRPKKSGGLYQRASDDMWCATIELPSPDPTKRRRKTIVRARKGDAIKALKQARADLEKAGDLRTSSPTVAQWCDLWWKRYAMRRLKVSTRDGYRSKIEQYIKPSIGRVRLDRLTPEHVYRMHEYVTDTKGLSASSALGAHRVLSVVLGDALTETRVTRNVAALARKPKARKKRPSEGVDYLSNAQARDLLMHSANRAPEEAARWAVAILAGARQAERLGLTRDSIDLDAGHITLAWQLKRVAYDHGCGTRTAAGEWPCGRKRGGNCPDRHLDIPEDQEVQHVEGGLYLLRPKSATSWRAFPMPPLLGDILRKHIEEHPPGVHGLIFTRDNGRPIDPADDSDEWHTALRLAGLPDVDGHSARHTCNTVLTELEVPVDVRRLILGHASNAINEAVYTHTSDARVAEAMRRLGAAMDWR